MPPTQAVVNLLEASSLNTIKGESCSQTAESCPRRSGWQYILINSTCLILAVALLTLAFIVYVVKHQFKPGDQGSELFPRESNVPSDNAIYVLVNAATLVFLASWMSSVVPLLTGSAIALATYPVAQSLFKDTVVKNRVDHLPTSFQLSLMLKLINGSIWRGLWGLLQYEVAWKKQTARRATTLTSLAMATIAALPQVRSVSVFSASSS